MSHTKQARAKEEDDERKRKRNTKERVLIRMSETRKSFEMGFFFF